MLEIVAAVTALHEQVMALTLLEAERRKLVGQSS
jgi:hypothetical protein